MLVFVSGPYTIGDVAANVRNAMEAASQLIDKGHLVFVPHLFHFLHMHKPQPYVIWTAHDNAFLQHCNALVRLSGVSPGADDEVILARQWRIPVYSSVKEFLKEA